MPPGDYLVVASDRSQMSDQAVLEQLRPSAVHVVLQEGDKKTQDLKVNAGTDR